MFMSGGVTLRFASATARILSVEKLLYLSWDDDMLVQATGLLQRENLQNAKASLEVLIADLQFLQDHVTITQVCSPSLESEGNQGI